MERLSTGNAELDLILTGGLPRNSINIIMGLPGSGKTILAEQFAFANASADRPVLYLSTLSEPLAKMLTYLQELAFADISRIGSEILFHSISEELKAGAAALPACVLKLIQAHRPGVIIIDSFKAVTDLLPDMQSWRQVVFELASLLTAYDTTSLWVGEYNQEMVPELVEFAVADGIIELSRVQSGSRDDRSLRVVKLRGSDFRDGNHAFSISREGLQVFPRLITPTVYAQYDPGAERLQSGIDGLDDMIETGWLRGTSTLVAGPSGAGKTMLGLHFLRYGVELGEPGILVTFQENPIQMRRAMRSLGWNVDDLLGAGKLDVLYKSPVELHIDSIASEIFTRIADHGVQRVVIDAMGDLEKSARDPRRFADYLYTMIQYFAGANVTAMLSIETFGPPFQNRFSRDESIFSMSDNTLLLSMELDNDLTRTVQIIKSRGSGHDGRSHVLCLSGAGMRVGPIHE